MVGEITGESIKSAIALKLKSSLTVTGGEPPISLYPTIYKEKIVQNMKKPSFFIWIMDVGQEKLMRNNFVRNYQMNIRYQVEEENEFNLYEKLVDMGTRVLEYLSEINVPIFLGRYDLAGDPIEDTKPVFGKQMSFSITEGVLQIFVTYSIKAQTALPGVPDMQTITIIQN